MRNFQTPSETKLNNRGLFLQPTVFAILAIISLFGRQTSAQQPAILAATGASDQAVVFPNANMPGTQNLVPGLPTGAHPHGVAYYGSDNALISDFSNSHVFVVQISTATLVSTIPTSPNYNGTGTIAVAPNLTAALTMGQTNQLNVIHAPFGPASPISQVTMPGVINAYQTQAIVFDNAGRAFVYHSTGISVLDAPYSSITFTIPVAGNSSTGAIAISPDGNTLLTTLLSGNQMRILQAPFSAASTSTSLTIPSGNALDGVMVAPNGTRAIVVSAFSRQAASVAAPFSSSSTVQDLPLPGGGGTDGFEDVGISADSQIAILTGNSGTDPAVLVHAPFGATSVTSLVPIMGVANPGRGAGAVRFLPPGLAPGLTISKSAPATVASGANLNYTISYSNTGTANATNVVIRDPLPAGTTFVSATNGGTLMAGSVVFDIGTVSAGAGPQTVSFTVTVNTAGGGTVDNNNYMIEGDGISPISGPPVTTAVTAQPILVAMVSLPVATVNTSVTNFTQPVITSAINPADNLVGFQGDFTFDETVVTFQSPPVSSAGLTASNWNVSGNVLPGAGPIRTLRISAFSLDFTPLSGSGTLFNLNMTRVSSTPGAITPLVWKPDPDNFIFIDGDLNVSPPGSTPAGSITIQASTLTISGTISYCTNPVPGPVSSVTLTLSGSGSGSTLSDGSGNYTFSSLTPGGSYTVTPGKAALTPGSAGIDTADVLATQRHYLRIALISPGCGLTAADVNGDTMINTVDVYAIQRFFIGKTFATANVGNYQFSPAFRPYPMIAGNQTAQNYDTLVFGDVVGPFVSRPAGPSQTAAGFGDAPSPFVRPPAALSQEASGSGTSAREVPATVATLSLPNVAVDAFVTNFIGQATTTAIGVKDKLVGFQGDFTFDERVVTFESEPVQKAGLTSGNWNVVGNVLPDRGPIRTLRISAYSNDLTPLAGSGILFELRIAKVSKAGQGTQLIWAAPPDNFIFIDADLNTQKPINTAPGSVMQSGKRK